MTYWLLVELWIRPDTTSDYISFEQQALEIMKKYGGAMHHALRPVQDGHCDELHILSFPSEASFQSYQQDEELATLSDLRHRAIAKTRVTVCEKGHL